MVGQHLSSLPASHSDNPGILIQEQYLHQPSCLYEDLELFFSVLIGFCTHSCLNLLLQPSSYRVSSLYICGPNETEFQWNEVKHTNKDLSRRNIMRITNNLKIRRYKFYWFLFTPTWGMLHPRRALTCAIRIVSCEVLLDINIGKQSQVVEARGVAHSPQGELVPTLEDSEVPISWYKAIYV